MKLRAYPKVNLCLKVYKGFVEGKHKLDSIMFLYKKLYDEITIRKASDLYILYKEEGKEISIADCLVAKSLKYLENKYGIDINYHIYISKHIPFASGLAGGSADAAAVINYVIDQQKEPIQLDLKEIALELGSDIPFLLSKYRIARVKEIGQYVTPIYNWSPVVTLHFNNVICSTTKVFAAMEQDQEYVSRVNVDKIIDNYLYKQHSINVVYNDLTKYIIQNYKELQEEYKKYPNKSFFTGAGSTIVTLKDR